MSKEPKEDDVVGKPGLRGHALRTVDDDDMVVLTKCGKLFQLEDVKFDESISEFDKVCRECSSYLTKPRGD